MKKLLAYIILCFSFQIAYSQEYKIDDVEKHIEMYADSVRQYNNYLIAESFAYDLLNFINYIHIYGPDSEKTIKRFGEVLIVEYVKIVSQIRYHSLNMDGWNINADLSVAKSVINLFRLFISDLCELYGVDYIVKLQNASNNSLSQTITESGNWGNYAHSRLNTYNIYNYDLMEITYLDELQLYLLHDQANNFLDLFSSILSSKLSEIAKAQIAQDCYDTLLDYQNPNMAHEILDMWYKYDDNKETHLYDYRERVRTKLGMLAYHQKNYSLAYFYSGWVDFVVEDKGKDIWRYFEDINEFLRQLETRALVESNTGADLDMACKKALNYFEFADSLITNDLRGKNQAKASPSMCSVIYRQLADLYIERKDYNAAESAILKATDIDDGYFNINTSLANVHLLMNMEKYDSAKEILHNCIDKLSIDKYNFKGKLDVYRYLLLVEKKLGDPISLSNTVEQFFTLQREYYYKELSLQPSYQRNYFWENEFELQYMAANAGHFASLNEKCTSIGYDVALFQKGLLLRFDKIEANNVGESNDVELIKAYQNLIDYSEKSVQDSIKYAAADLYATLYSTHPEFVTDVKHLAWEDIQTVLEPGEIAIEFIETYDTSNNDIYGAYLLGPTYERPIFVVLCKSETLKSLLKNPVKGGYFSNIYHPSEQTKVYDLIWSDIEPYLEGVNRIYFSPHGLLTQLNIEILSNIENPLPLNQRYDMCRISSTALLVDNNNVSDYSSAVLIGGIDYNCTPQNQYVAIDTTEYLISTTRGLDEKWKQLPHTIIEVDKIDKLLRNKRISTSVYTGELGSEKFVKSLTYQNNSIIHIATHGFYYPYNEARKKEYFTLENEDEQAYISPLRRSGLVMAGANHAWLGSEVPENVEDGILSASEIANMNLNDTELVVLSACQTGLGEISTEGVSGIQRAFKLAGVKTLIMSLWEVNDEATSIMMTNFYKNLTKGKSKRESFNAAIQSVKKWNDNPYYWAAFIMLD